MARSVPTPDSPPDDRTRLDKWLWAARFFKTRALAAAAIEGGKVNVNEERAKRARPVREGDEVRIRSGPFEHRVIVRALSSRRGPASEAATLYEELPESRAARERVAAYLRTQGAQEAGRPTKKDRRELRRLRDRG
ncbi:MAG TPA: RNA-binding S4 domain-containing protein [Gemmatimonadaceae bacterium]|nr:RNA-binding S4 domain-containing protein [Gemmatimonadaceae bacterium]